MEVDEEKKSAQAVLNPTGRIQFASLEHNEKDKKKGGGSWQMMTGAEENEEDITQDPEGLNIEIQSNDLSTTIQSVPLSGIHLQAHVTQKRLIEDLELRRKARSIAVPTSDELVKARLTELEEPVILFGETKPLRRHRLRLILAQKGISQGIPSILLQSSSTVSQSDEAIQVSRPFVTEGTPELLKARLAILHDSFLRSSARLHEMKLHEEFLCKESEEEWYNRMDRMEQNFYQPITTILPTTSVVADQRPLSSVTFMSDGSTIATTSWNNLCKLWNVENCMETMTLRGHSERVISAKFHPKAQEVKSAPPIDSDGGTVNLATASADNTVILWSIESGKSVAVLKGHEDRVNIVDFHPTGNWLAVSSHDKTWSLWDVTQEKMILKQDGHSRPVYGLTFHPDGALIATGGIDSVARVWDIRSGKPIHNFLGHAKQILGMDWHPHGHILATGSDDHTVRIWDMRMKKLLYIIPAHNALVSDLKFAPHHGLYMVTSGFDNVAKVWKCSDWNLLATLSGHGAKISGVDISPRLPPNPKPQDNHSILFPDEEHLPYVKIATSGFDRTWKLWTI